MNDFGRDIARHIENGLPMYAECAGLMYLSRAIRWQGRRYEMVGVMPAEVEISKRPQGHGYVEMEVAADNPWFPSGPVLQRSRISPFQACRGGYAACNSL